MRRFSRRERRLMFALCGVAALGATSFYMAPKQAPSQEEVVSYYAKAFGSANQITIRPVSGGGQPVTVTREKAPKFFSRLETVTRIAGVTLSSMPDPPKYVLDLVRQDGSEIKDISVGFTVQCPKQPAKGQLALVPRDLTIQVRGPVPVMAMIIEDYLDELHNPQGAKERQRKRRQEVLRQTQAWMSRRGGAASSDQRPGRAAAEAPKVSSGAESRPKQGPATSP